MTKCIADLNFSAFIIMSCLSECSLLNLCVSYILVGFRGGFTMGIMFCFAS